MCKIVDLIFFDKRNEISLFVSKWMHWFVFFLYLLAFQTVYIIVWSYVNNLITLYVRIMGMSVGILFHYLKVKALQWNNWIKTCDKILLTTISLSLFTSENTIHSI